MEVPKPSGPALPVTEGEWIASSQGCCGTESETSRSCCSSEPPTLHEGLSEIIGRYNVNDYAASVRVFAVKPCRDLGVRAGLGRRPILRGCHWCRIS